MVAESELMWVPDVTARATPRQLRLFAVACCRIVWDRLTDDVSREAVELAERFADGLASTAELDAARRSAYRALGAGDIAKLAADAAKREAHQAAYMAEHIMRYAAEGSWPARAAAMRCIFGNTPRRVDGTDFAPVAFEVAWHSPRASSLVEAAYSSRDFSSMPTLAEALEEAGCREPWVLGHSRASGPHYRGCWVVDLALGK